MHVEILTIVIRFMGGVPTAFLRARDGQPEDLFFQIFFHHDLGEEKSVTLLLGLLKNRS